MVFLTSRANLGAPGSLCRFPRDLQTPSPFDERKCVRVGAYEEVAFVMKAKLGRENEEEKGKGIVEEKIRGRRKR